MIKLPGSLRRGKRNPLNRRKGVERRRGREEAVAGTYEYPIGGLFRQDRRSGKDRRKNP